MQKTIQTVRGYELLDSRGNPTVGAFVCRSDGAKGFAIAPSGASTGSHEAHELRDFDERYFGKGVFKAVEAVNRVLAPAIVQSGTTDQRQIDSLMRELDGTENKSALGANAILAVSLALSKANANGENLPLYRHIGGLASYRLPVPMMNVLNGGAHADNNLDIQEFMIVPKKFDRFSERLRAGAEIYHTLKALLRADHKATGVGDEGGFAPDLAGDEEALDYLCRAIREAGYEGKVELALDIASSEWQTPEGYFLPKRRVSMTASELVRYYESLCDNYPICSLEDGCSEDDIAGWQQLTAELSRRVMLVGDDLFVTDAKRVENGAQLKIANAVLIKPNQIGTLSETMEVLAMCEKEGYRPVISHRSGDSEDALIADLAVAVNAPFIKTGAPCRSERTAKYNRLLIIESEIGESPVY